MVMLEEGAIYIFHCTGVSSYCYPNSCVASASGVQINSTDAAVDERPRKSTVRFEKTLLVATIKDRFEILNLPNL